MDVDVPLPFSDQSALRIVFRERIVQFSGLRALLLEGLSPSMVAGFLQHSDMFDSREQTIKRLMRTGEQMNTIYFSNNVANIQKLCAGLRKGHSFVKGTLPGSNQTYRADDPEHLLWVIASIADSAWNFYERWRGKNHVLREAFWREYRIVGRLFGLEEKEMPTDWNGLQNYINNFGPSLVPLPESVELARGLLYEMDPPGFRKMFVPFVKWSTLDSLPPWARKAYSMEWEPAKSVVWRTSLNSGLPFRRFIPNKLAYMDYKNL